MSLSPGTRLGVYDITAQIGEGGMGQVFRATDTKLKRQVAIKILPAALAADPVGLARFQREAEVLASLNHPHIAAIYGLEEAEGIKALVMELVEGDDLADRIGRGPVSTGEALPIARQMAEALEAANEVGIVHRDFKPANIKLRADGTVKVLDFGLAKRGGGDADRSGQAGHGLSQSPTISPATVTGAGVILGTAAYMAPEQARGQAADTRADIWAFGVVVFEMLTGRRLFTGETVSDTLASVLKTEPDWRSLPAPVPQRLRSLLRWCLDKNPKRRLQAIGDARLQIDDLMADVPEEPGGAVPATRATGWGRVWPWVLIGGLATALVAALWAPGRVAPSPGPIRVSAELGADASLAFDFGDAISISPDGHTVAFVARRSGGDGRQLYVRRLTQLQATALPGTEDADGPFFSPDGQWVAFFAGGKLKKIAATGGPVVTLCDEPDNRGGTWGDDDTIVFYSSNSRHLMHVPASGGVPEPLTTLLEGEASQRWPQILPGGKGVLYSSSGLISGGGWDEASLVVLASSNGARTVVQRGAYHGRYVPSGHLVYIRAGTLFAVPFDLGRLAVTGPPAPVLEGVAANPLSGGAQFAVSASGTVVFLPGQSRGSVRPLAWMDRTGKTTAMPLAPMTWFNPLFSPDGRRLAVQIADGSANDIFVYEWTRDTLTPLTFDPANDRKPVWTPDGGRIAFSSARADRSIENLYWQRADGTDTDAQRLTSSPHLQVPSSWHPSGKFLAFEEENPATKWDVMILPMEGDEASGWKPGTATVFVNGPDIEMEPMFSPDGRWLAYVSHETGTREVFVRPFPGPGGKWQVSTGGGHTPTWSRTRRELFFGSNGRLMVVPYDGEGASFRPEQARRWSEGRFIASTTDRMFDLHPDGARFVLAPVGLAQGRPQPEHLTFLFNVFDELRRRVPLAK